MKEIVVVEGGVNQFLYCPPNIYKELEEKGMLKDFASLLQVPKLAAVVGDTGLKPLDKDKSVTPPDIDFTIEGKFPFTAKPILELKHQHGTSRVFCVELGSDSKDKGKQGTLYVLFKISPEGLHTQAKIDSFLQGLKVSKFDIKLPEKLSPALSSTRG